MQPPPDRRPATHQGSSRSGGRVVNRVSSTAMRRSPEVGQQNFSCPSDTFSGRTSSPRQYVPNNFRSHDYYEFRVPYMPQSTPIQGYNFPSQHPTFGSQIEYLGEWLPKEPQLSGSVDPTVLKAAGSRKGQSPKSLRRDPGPAFDSKYMDASPIVNDSRYLLSQSKLNEAGFSSPTKQSPKRESLMEWFDRTVEEELRKRREASLNIGENFVSFSTPSRNPMRATTKSPRCSNPLITQASTSGMDIQSKLRKNQDTELTDAVDKLAKAEAMCAFEGAVRAAEAAAASAPPEYAEEAAAAGAQGFQTELTNVSVVQQEFDGVKPIEVVGYVGITRPKKIKKPDDFEEA